MHLGLLYDRLGDAEGTAHCVGLLESARDTNPEVPFRLAQLHVRCSDPSIRNPSAAISLLSLLVEDRLLAQGATWNLLAEAHALEGRYDAAIEAMDRALESSQPGDPLWSQYAQRRDHCVAATVDP
jgi:tetratricopeptide (TPR) repeat protein